jgi:hypothetical protein
MLFCGTILFDQPVPSIANRKHPLSTSEIHYNFVDYLSPDLDFKEHGSDAPKGLKPSTANREHLLSTKEILQFG